MLYNYIIVEVEYTDFDLSLHRKVKIYHEFDTPQKNLEYALQMCIKDFYSKSGKNCEIQSIKTIDVSCLSEVE